MSIPSLLESIRRGAQAMPSRIAIHDGTRTCSHARLWTLSDHVAGRLREAGVAPGDVVGIALPRSTEWVAAMLGVLKCGAAYLPLDPDYPHDRLAFCIEDSGARHVIAGAGTPRIGTRTTLSMDSLLRAQATAATLPAPDAGAPAYVLYTSGSTGRPKGVVVSMAALAYQMDWFVRQFAFTADDVVVHKTSTAFDASVWEYLAPLMVGGAMVIAGNAPAAIAQAAQQHRATILQVVPAVMQAMTEPALMAALRSVRMLFCGGEPLPRRLVDQVHAYLPIPVVNLYGPTETTVQCAFHVCEPGQADERDPVPLGKPIPGTVFRILGADAQAGAGELLIEGPGVAQGYQGLPQETASRFGVSPGTGQRSYRSGDLVRLDDHGDYLFLGRADNQVKLRGLRIELEEIEAALCRTVPGVRHATAVINAAEQIEAYVEVRPGDWDEAAARAAMAEALPRHMQPAILTPLEHLPLLPNGKHDRNAVKAMAAARGAAPAPAPEAQEASRPPQGACAAGVAEQVRTIWAALLPHSTGDDSHFFQAGGHSLLAMRLVARINAALDVQLLAVTLFARPTLRCLIDMVEQAVRERERPAVTSGIVRIAGQSGQPPIWFVHPAGGGIWCYRDIATSVRTVESLGISCEPRGGAGAYENNVPRMARWYADRVLAHQSDGPYVLCGYSFGGTVAHEMAVDLQSRGAHVALLVLLDTFITRATGGDILDFVTSYARKLADGADHAPSRAQLGGMSIDERNRVLLKMGVQGGHLPADASMQDLEQGLAMWIANNLAASTHQPHGKFNGPTLFIRCTGNTRDSLDGWPSLLGDLHVRDVPADHFTVYRPPVATHVAALIEQAVRQFVPHYAHVPA
ncbi:amino acid adenylation domain-containing protein [Bordetella flabilis]|nr:amino acid adenylation domain-containing protein [Bordetella flabilis]